MKEFNYMLEIDILRSSSHKELGVVRDALILSFWMSKRCPDILLAKTMYIPSNSMDQGLSHLCVQLSFGTQNTIF